MTIAVVFWLFMLVLFIVWLALQSKEEFIFFVLLGGAYLALSVTLWP